MKAAKAKSARRRIVPILPNLAAWLRPYSGITSDIVPPGAGRKLERVREQAGLTHLAKERLTAFLCQLSVGGEFSATASFRR